MLDVYIHSEGEFLPTQAHAHTEINSKDMLPCTGPVPAPGALPIPCLTCVSHA